MPISARTGSLQTLQNAATGPAAGTTVANPGVGEAVIEVSGTYTNLEATFEVSIDGGTRFWALNLEVLSSGTSAPKMTTPGLYGITWGAAAITHFRTPITTPGAPTGAMTIKVVGILN